MKFDKPVTVKEIAEIIGAREILGDPSKPIYGINEIHRVKEGDITFVDHPKYFGKAVSSPASALIAPQPLDVDNGKVVLVVDKPFKAYNKLIRHFFKKELPQGTFIHESAEIHPTAHISPGVFIGRNVKIGANTVIYPNVVILDNVEIGNNVKIGPGTVIGYDAFYYKRWDDGTYEQMESCGRVIIEDNVDIGANCTIDKAVSSTTVIKRGTKIDNLTHIAHGVIIGENCLISAQVGIAGKTIIGNKVILWGQVGISKSLTIGDNAEIYAQSGVDKSLPGNKAYFGSPAQEARKAFKQLAILRFLAEYWESLKSLILRSNKNKRNERVA